MQRQPHQSALRPYGRRGKVFERVKIEHGTAVLIAGIDLYNGIPVRFCYPKRIVGPIGNLPGKVEPCSSCFGIERIYLKCLILYGDSLAETTQCPAEGKYQAGGGGLDNGFHGTGLI